MKFSTKIRQKSSVVKVKLLSFSQLIDELPNVKLVLLPIILSGISNKPDTTFNELKLFFE